MANGVITWNGVASDTLGIVVSKVPSLNRPQRKYNSYSVPGRNGDIVVMQDAYADYEQEYEIFALDGAQIDARAIADWLYQDGWCELSDDWEPDYYRMAYFVGPVDIEPIMSEAAVCTITFRCRPQRYIVQNPISVNDGDTITNTTKHTALPIITLTGSSVVKSLLNLGKTVGFSETGGTKWKSQYLTNFGYCDYTGTNVYCYSGGSITLNNNTGTVTFTSLAGHSSAGVGTGVSVNPNTFYTISCADTSSVGEIKVLFYSNEGEQKLTDVVMDEFGGGNVNSFTFATPVNCNKILIIIYRAGTYSNIMLNQGMHALPFQPYGADSVLSFAINNTKLQFSTSGFNTAVIDCERENFIIDGANANMNATVLDQYGNLSSEFLNINQGSNLISISTGIATATIETRYWDL